MEKLWLNVVIADWRGLKSWGAAGAGSLAGQDIPVAKSTHMYDEPMHSAACSFKYRWYTAQLKLGTRLISTAAAAMAYLIDIIYRSHSSY